MKTKNKIVPLISILAVAILCFVFYIRYHAVNANVVNNGHIEEVLIQKNQEVHAYHEDFKITQVSVTKQNDEVKVKLQMQLHKTGQSNYGFHKNNPNFGENMWLNVPYSIAVPAKVTTIDNKRLSYKQLLNRTDITVNVLMSAPMQMYNRANKKARFSFLVPTNRSYVKYSLLLE